MSYHTDSYTVTHHEDGTWTEESTVTHRPATRNEKIVAWSAVGACLLLPTVPLLFLVAVEKAEELNEKRIEKKAARKAAKLKSV